MFCVVRFWVLLVEGPGGFTRRSKAVQKFLCTRFVTTKCLITARYTRKYHKEHQVVLFWGAKVGFATKYKFEDVDQQVVSLQKLHRIFMLDIFAFCSGQP